MLDRLYYDLQTYKPEIRHIETTSLPHQKPKLLSKLTNVFKTSNSTKDFVDRPKSLYIYGGAGCGKVFTSLSSSLLFTFISIEQSLLMDIFFECMPINEKRRVHFNSFMLEFHNRILKKNKKKSSFIFLSKFEIIYYFRYASSTKSTCCRI